MKSSGSLWQSLAVVGCVLAWMPVVHAQNPAGESFPGVKQALTPQQYSAAGIGKLSPDEQAKLDEYLKNYFSGATQRVAERAATQAVDRAVKEKKAVAPSIIESRIVGTFTGWTNRTVFVLENGERWKPLDNNTHASFPPTDNPQVYIVRDTFGYKMAILGGTTLRVRRL